MKRVLIILGILLFSSMPICGREHPFAPENQLTVEQVTKELKELQVESIRLQQESLKLQKEHDSNVRTIQMLSILVFLLLIGGLCLITFINR